jgi:RNA polymerase sigma factor (sigma-70 family)
MSEEKQRGPTTGSADDAAVIRASLRDPQAFGLLFSRYAPDIHRYLALRLGREAADDLVGETFTVAFRRRDRYDLERPNARPWLYGIATRLVGQHRRDEARRYRLHLAVAPDRADDGHVDRVVAEVTARGMRVALERALADLSAGDRDVLLLVAWGELTYEEVAGVLSIPVGTVRSRLNRARTKLKKGLAIKDSVMPMKERLVHG